jgi:diadenosine tetraphosphate (Ap4A) HIT family hydrolase
MTDLNENERIRLMKTVFVVERVLRDLLEPEKVNLASFGNMVPVPALAHHSALRRRSAFSQTGVRIQATRRRASAAGWVRPLDAAAVVRIAGEESLAVMVQ